MKTRHLLVSHLGLTTELQIQKGFEPILWCGWALWQYGLWILQMGGIKLKKKMHKNQHTQRTFLNFENWTNGEPQ